MVIRGKVISQIRHKQCQMEAHLLWNTNSMSHMMMTLNDSEGHFSHCNLCNFNMLGRESERTEFNLPLDCNLCNFNMLGRESERTEFNLPLDIWSVIWETSLPGQPIIALRPTTPVWRE